MKKLFITSFIIGLFVFSALAQDNVVKFNAFGMIVNQYQLSYERAMGENASLQLSAGYLTGTNSATINGVPWWESKRNGFLVIPEARYYFKESLRGLYGAAFFRYRVANWEVNDLDDGDFNWSYTNTRTAIGGGIVLGFQALISDAVCIDIFIGPQYKSVSSDKKYVDSTIDEDLVPTLDLKTEGDGVGVRFGVNFGFAF